MSPLPLPFQSLRRLCVTYENLGYRALANNPHEVVQVTSFVEQINIMKSQGILPQDTRIMIVPSGNPQKGAPDISVYSEELNKSFTVQFKYKSNGCYTLDKFHFMSDVSYKNTNDICLLVDAPHLQEQLNVVNQGKLSSKILIMAVDQEKIDKNSEVICAMIVRGIFEKASPQYKKFTSMFDNNVVTAVWSTNPSTNLFSSLEVPADSMKAVVPSKEVDQVAGNFVQISDPNQSFLGTNLYAGPSRAQILRDHGLEVTSANLFHATNLGWFDKK